MAFPIAMYSNSFVGDPKNGEPSAFGTCGDARISHAARYSGPASCSTSPVKMHDGAQARVLDDAPECRQLRSGANHQQPHRLGEPGFSRDQAREGVHQHLAPCQGWNVEMNPTTVLPASPSRRVTAAPSTDGV